MDTSKNLHVITEIKKQHGGIIDLDKNPKVLIEIIRNFRHRLDEVAGEDGTGGAPGSPPPPPPPPTPAIGDVGNATVLNLLLELKREVRELGAKIR